MEIYSDRRNRKCYRLNYASGIAENNTVSNGDYQRNDHHRYPHRGLAPATIKASDSSADDR